MSFTVEEVEDETACASAWTAVGVVAGIALVALACE
jgi:hypothetical protein